MEKISERERKVLIDLAEVYGDEADCRFMKYIGERTDLEYSQVRRSVRSLARKGYAEFVRGLFNDEGMVAGSGYRATKEGALLVKACIDCKKEVSNMTDGRCMLCWEIRKCEKCGKPYDQHKLVNGYRQEFVFTEVEPVSNTKLEL